MKRCAQLDALHLSLLATIVAWVALAQIFRKFYQRFGESIKYRIFPRKLGGHADILRVVLLLRNIRHLIRPASSPLSDPYPDDPLIPLALMYENMRVIQVFDPCFAAIHVHAAVGPEPLPHHPAPCARPHSRDTLGAAALCENPFGVSLQLKFVLSAW